jgi:hypothetical protein
VAVRVSGILEKWAFGKPNHLPRQQNVGRRFPFPASICPRDVFDKLLKSRLILPVQETEKLLLSQTLLPVFSCIEA